MTRLLARKASQRSSGIPPSWWWRIVVLGRMALTATSNTRCSASRRCGASCSCSRQDSHGSSRTLVTRPLPTFVSRAPNLGRHSVHVQARLYQRLGQRLPSGLRHVLHQPPCLGQVGRVHGLSSAQSLHVLGDVGDHELLQVPQELDWRNMRVVGHVPGCARTDG